MDAVEAVEEPEVGVVRLAHAWRQAATERATGRAGVANSHETDEPCATDLARAVLNALCLPGDDTSCVDDRTIASHPATNGPSRVSMAAARFGATQAMRGGSVYDLVADLMALERAALRIQLADACSIHATMECAMLAGTAAFTRAVAEAERKRVRDVRHDLTNAVGTVRNAILLMDEESECDARRHFLDIARRNSDTAQALVREHLSEDTAVPAWLDCSRHVTVSEQPGQRVADSPREQRHNLARADKSDDRNIELQ